LIKRFSEKLLVNITDGQKFGNVLCSSYQKLDREAETLDMMGYGMGDMNQENDEEFQEENDRKEEYSGYLLLGDRSCQ